MPTPTATTGFTIRLPLERHEQLAAHREETGVPINTFINRAIAAALDKARAETPKRQRRNAG